MRDIAIVGLSFEFPGADSSESFWDLMMSGKCVASQFPEDRISGTKYHSTDGNRTGTIRPQQACFVDRDVTVFDAQMFGMTPDEAVGADPQQRILLEVTLRALENAGIPIDQISGSDTSVYTGCFSADYMLCCGKDPESQPKYAATGVAASMLSNRLSTFFNLTGPSATVDTACSSSLVALDMACRSIHQGESSVGIVAGCNVLLSPDYFIGLSSLGFLSPDGVCHSFDGRANGYGRGEGFGVLIIKPVEDAIRDGNTIRAVIRATGTNQNGRTTLAQPSKEMQMALIKDVYRKAKLNPLDTKFFEAHGTGTAIGDPLEAMAIGNTFSPGRSSEEPLIVGAVKANIGHLEGCAGIAGVIKSILVLEKGIIPPIAELGELNTAIDAEFLKLQFPKASQPFPSEGLRRASVNSFGFGGTNSHVILDDAYHYLQSRGLVANHCTLVNPTLGQQITLKDEPDLSTASNLDSRPRLFTWSANEESTLTKMTTRYGEHLGQSSTSDIRLDALAYTLSEKRTLYDWRSCAVATSKADLMDQLLSPRSATQRRSDVNLGFIFTGQGAQWSGMGKELMTYPIFERSLAEAESYLLTLGCEWRVRDVLLGKDGCNTSINEPRFAQPLSTVIQIALIELLLSFDIHPKTVVGHSSGEIAAAFTMGAISRHTAWKLAYFRGMLSSKLADMSLSSPENCGVMMAVGLSESEIRPYLEEVLKDAPHGILTVACINSPKNCTVSGDKNLVEAAQKLFQRDGAFNRMLKVPVAYHSAQMEQIAADYLELIHEMTPGESTRHYTNMVSSVTGENIAPSELQSPQYWVRNLVSPVRFADALGRVCERAGKMRPKLDLSHLNSIPITDFVEIGPHSALQGPIREIVAAASPSSLAKDSSYSSALVRGRSAVQTLLELVGNLHCLGLKVDLVKANQIPEEHGSSRFTLATLPEYPFNHSKSYWSEPRISRHTRLGSHSYNEFIGSPVSDWNPLQPRWRNILKTSTMPWVEDHKINGDILYPAAGMCVMAIEAMTQISQLERILAYEIRDFDILAALTIPADDVGVETELSLKLSSDATSKTNSSATFSLAVWRNDTFVEICTGSVKVIGTSQSQTTAELDPGKHKARFFGGLIDSFDTTSVRDYEAQGLYEELLGYGYRYGPSFQGIEHAHRNMQGEIIGHVSTRRPEPITKAGIPTAVHPATLDNMWQLMIPALVVEDIGKWKTWIPTHISKLWVSASGFEVASEPTMAKVFASTKPRSARMCESIIHAADEFSGEILLQIDGVESSVLITDSLPADELADSSQMRRLCYDMVQKPDVTTLGADRTLEYVYDGPSQEEPTDLRNMLKLYILSSMVRTAGVVSEAEVPLSPPHLRMQYGWIQSQLKSAEAQTPDGLPADWREYAGDSKFEDLASRLESTGRLGQIYRQFSVHLIDILRGNTDALQVLAEGDTLRDYYDEFNKQSQFFAPLGRYLDILAHKNPGMKMLEVGAGTGSTTKYILDTLSVQTSQGLFSRFAQYDFTDISPAFLDKASEEFQQTPKLNFCLFDAEKDPETQEYEPYSYDVVFAVNVLHATKLLSHTLGNLRRLLKTSGKLIIVEITKNTSTLAHSIFGYLPGWWQSQESWRQNGPIATVAEWNQELQKTGFSGAELVFEDSALELNQFQSLMVASAVEESSALPSSIVNKRAFVLTGWQEPSDSSLAQLSVNMLRESGVVDVRNSSFLEASLEQDLSESLVVVVQSGSWLSLGDLSPEHYTLLNSAMKRSKYTMWISDASPKTAPSPMGSVQGFGRALRMETFGRVFAVTSVDFTWEDAVPQVLQKSLQNFLQGVQTGTYEPEIIQDKDMLHIPRAYESAPRNEAIHYFTSDLVETEQKFGERNLKMEIRQPGLLDSLYFTEDLTESPPLGHKEVIVNVEAIGVNFRDCLIALGRADQDILGCECAGTIAQTGPGCNFSVGDKVIVSTLGTYRSQVRCPESLIAKIPNGIKTSEAAGLATVFITAYHSLVKLARLSRGESILIHSGAGGTGQAAIQIAKLCGAEIFTTVGSEVKRELISEQYGIPADHILNSRDLSFADKIKQLTHNRGVDVVLNSLAGDALVASWECVAPYGRFIEIGKKDITTHNKLPMGQFLKNVSFSAVDVGAMTYERPDLIQDSLSAVMDLFARNQLSLPHPIKFFPISNVEGAFRYMQGGTHSGKIVVEIDRNEVLKATIKPRSEWNLSSNDTFLIAGGLGAQGKKIARWMVGKGARHLVLLSRKGEQGEENIAFVRELRDAGANVYCPQCDVSSASSLSATLEYCKENMPPIKGCVQTAMDLQDSIFENMSHDMWQACLRPKIQGSWNLHSQLPQGLDFFILFSSIAGVIGSQGQANYAAGNTFQDALAQFRLSQGEKAISVNFGLLEGEGWATDNRDAMLQFMNTKHIMPMSPGEVLAVLEYYCNKDLPIDPAHWQLMTGLEIQSDVISRGLEPCAWMSEPMFSNLLQLTGTNTEQSDDQKASGEESMELTTQVQAADSVIEAADIVAKGLASKLAKILSLKGDSFDFNRPIHIYGVDSLVAVELRNWFQKAAKVDVAVFEILGGGTTSSLGRIVAEKMLA